MMLVFILREVQGYRSVGFTVDKLLHLSIGTGSNFLRRPLRDNIPVSEHNHPGHDSKCTRHIMRDDNRGHASFARELQR